MKENLKDKKHWIYIIGTETKPYKIGFSCRPKKRLKDIQTGHPEKLSIHYLEEINSEEIENIERQIHNNIRHLKTHGEWFNLDLDEAKREVQFAVIRYSK